MEPACVVSIRRHRQATGRRCFSNGFPTACEINQLAEDKRGAIALLTVDNPPVNALSHGVRAGLVEGLDTALADDDVTAIVIACAGRTFIAGADIKEFGKSPLEPYLPDLVRRIEDCGKPVIAVMLTLGGGHPPVVVKQL